MGDLAVQRWTVSATGDANMRCLQKGDILQLERKGYFRVDVPLLKPTAPIILFAIPDGRVRSTLPQPTAAASKQQPSFAPGKAAPRAAAGGGKNGPAAAQPSPTQPAAAPSASAAAPPTEGASGSSRVSPHHTGAAAPVGASAVAAVAPAAFPPSPSQPPAAGPAAAAAPAEASPGVSKVSLHHTGAAAPIGAAEARPAAAPTASRPIPPPPTPLIKAVQALNSQGALSPPAVLQAPPTLPSLSTQASAPIEGLPAGSPVSSPMKQSAKVAASDAVIGPSLLGASRGAAPSGFDDQQQSSSSLHGSPAGTVRLRAPAPAATPPPTPAASMELPKSVQHRIL